MILEVAHDFLVAGMFTFSIEVVGRALGDAYDEAKAEEKEEASKEEEHRDIRD